MYGYISLYFKPNDEERKKYLYYYCGICHSLKKNFGNIYRPTIIKEVVLFAMMNEEYKDISEFRCTWMHFGKRYKPNNLSILDKYSYLNMLIIYGKLLDYKFEGTPIPNNYIKKLKNKLLKEFDEQLIEEYEFYLKKQDKIEKKLLDLDEYAKPSQELTKIMMKNYFKDIEDTVPISIGMLIYLVDSIYDFKKDLKKKKFNAIRASFNVKKIENLKNEEKKRILFTYDICAKEIIENSDKLSKFNKYLVKKLLTFSFQFHRIEITKILMGVDKNENKKNIDGRGKLQKIILRI
ncbi:hypothetical protein OSSY52_20670 [Tepiditoga spiralis]|uniref:Uncharacterized protein n=1 Tax=Tepiditoga spiralis TaxID=2108365 RepID=A0A7G1G905_9BACT|nr:DUF5685 family protein [Tepiditoga spiralis]BBE31926.1 hypothetical protein OSSY52_20670 [Tepiditoga spiralis]